jgi:hypothetical protein
MRGDILPLPHYAFMAWCSVKKTQGQLYLLSSSSSPSSSLLLHKEVNRKLNLGSACCHSVRNPLYHRLLFKNFKIYKTIILPFVLYGCETWSVALREEHRLRVFENRVLRIFVPKWEEVAGGWRKLHNVELHNLYSSRNIIRVIK